jgi:hypothetical protein
MMGQITGRSFSLPDFLACASVQLHDLFPRSGDKGFQYTVSYAMHSSTRSAWLTPRPITVKTANRSQLGWAVAYSQVELPFYRTEADYGLLLAVSAKQRWHDTWYWEILQQQVR